MKVLIFLFVVPSIVVMAGPIDELKKTIEARHTACKATSKVDQSILDNARKGSIDESNPALKTHLACYCKKAGFIREDGTLDVDVIKQKISAQVKDTEAVAKITKKCNSIKNEGDIDTFATSVIACYVKEVPAGTIVI